MANYPLVPWMNSVSPVEPYLQGQATGARIGAELADRTMRQRQMEQQMQLAAQAQAAENARFQQEYALRKAQAEAEIAIRQQTAEQKRAAEAMRQQAMMDIQRDIEGGMPEAQAYARHWFKTGESLAGLPQMLREANPGQTQFSTYKVGDNELPYALNQRTGSVNWGPVVRKTGVSQYAPPNVQKEWEFAQKLYEDADALESEGDSEQAQKLRNEADAVISKSIKNQDLTVNQMTSILGVVADPEVRQTIEQQLKSFVLKKPANKPMPAVPIAEARRQANEAIKNRKNPDLVKKRFKELYGEEL